LGNPLGGAFYKGTGTGLLDFMSTRGPVVMTALWPARALERGLNSRERLSAGDPPEAREDDGRLARV